jgi:hypothetical protein|nr:MAG TPA: nucelotide kinase [Caudoviricetes sp.]
MQIKNTKKIMQIIAKLDEFLDLLDEQKFTEFSKKYEAWDHHLALLSSCFSEKSDPVIPGAKSLVEKRALLKNVAVQEAYVRGFVSAFQNLGIAFNFTPSGLEIMAKLGSDKSTLPVDNKYGAQSFDLPPYIPKKFEYWRDAANADETVSVATDAYGRSCILDQSMYAHESAVADSIPTDSAVHSPAHYVGTLGLEVSQVLLEFVKNKCGLEAHHWCSAVEYLLRYAEKNGAEDLEKAKVNLEWLLEDVYAAEATKGVNHAWRS